jgi:hypothetical protein
MTDIIVRLDKRRDKELNITDLELLLLDAADEIERMRGVLQSSGFRRCDIPACNCGSWHHVGGYAERFREIKEAVEEAGYSTNGKLLIDVIKDVLASSVPSQKSGGIDGA